MIEKRTFTIINVTMMVLAALTAIIFLMPLTGEKAAAHEGHDHDAPQMIAAPKGGIIKSLEQTHVEVVSKGTAIRVYLYGKGMKPADATKYKVTARADLPRKKGSHDIKLAANGNAFEGAFDAGGAHRYTLALTIVDPKTGHNDKLTFTIEPRK